MFGRCCKATHRFCEARRFLQRKVFSEVLGLLLQNLSVVNPASYFHIQLVTLLKQNLDIHKNQTQINKLNSEDHFFFY